MRAVSKENFAKGGIAAAVICGGLALPLPANADTPMTAGVVLEKMGTKELFAYVYGIVDGMAYARFRKDTIAAGTKDETGMKCIYDWYFSGDASTFDKVEATFKKYPEHLPATLLATMLKKECGE